MPLPNAVLRQYTPPTCTLEIMARSSPQPRGVGLTATAPLNFILRFDDPRLISDPKSIQGDRYQLEDLHQAVTTYVQNLLKKSPEHFTSIFSDAPVSSIEASKLSNPDSASTLKREEIVASVPTVASDKIFLQAADSSGLAHNLFLGSLKNNASGSAIQLGVLQLFDLVTALEECAADVVRLPQNRRLLASAPSTWAGIAAVLLLAMGITTAVVLYLRPKPHRQIATTTVVQSPNINNQQSVTTQPSVTPLPLPSSLGILPSPPTGVLVPSPGLNKGAKRNTLPTDTIPLNQPTGVYSPPTPSGILITPRQQAAVNVPSGTTTIPTPSITQAPATQQRLPAISNVPSSISPSLTPIPGLGTETTPDSANLGGSKTPLPKAPSSDLSKGTAFDTIPQVAEARNYFKKRWEPPSGLTQTLEYSLILDTDGTIKRIIPLGQAARIYVDRTGMPLAGTPFVSPIKNGQTPKIRVVLSPDGQVQTFQDSEN